MCVEGCREALVRALSRRRIFAAGAAFAATAAAPAIAAPRPGRRVIDLTHAMTPQFPTFDGKPGIELQKAADFRKDGYNLYRWMLNEHSGTHLDAPLHFSDDGLTADQIAADALVVPLAVVDIAAKAAANPDYQLGRDDLAQWERRHGRLPDNCCVAMHAGWARHVDDPAKYHGRDAAGVMHFPGIAPDAVAWLIKQRRVAGIAVDTLSLDHGASKDFRTHLLWLPAGRWGLENVANLDRVPASGATLMVGLAKVRGASGGPARLFALA